MMLVEVEESGLIAEVMSVTWTDSLDPATVSAKCNRSSPSEASVICWVWGAKPSASTCTVQLPRATLSNRNSPEASLVVLTVHFDVFAQIVTFAPWTGRCWESWIRPVMEPKIEALRFVASSRTATNSAQ